MRKSGVKARNGTLRLIGETFKARVYRIIALISRGRAQRVAIQKVLFKGGISVNSRVIESNGSEKSNLAHATKYSSLEDRARFVRASLVAKKKAVKRE
jgi:hypothetical protein